MKCLSLQLYCAVSVLAMAAVLYKVSHDDQTLNLFLTWRMLTMVRWHYFVFANFLAMVGVVCALGALRFFFGPIKEGEKIVRPPLLASPPLTPAVRQREAQDLPLLLHRDRALLRVHRPAQIQ